MAGEKKSSFRIRSFDSDGIHFDSFPCALAFWTRDFSRGQLNRLAKSLIRCSEPLYNGSFWLDHVHRDDREQYLSFRKRVITEESALSCDYRLISDDLNQPVWVREVSIFNDSHQAPLWDVKSIYLNISDLKTTAAMSAQRLYLKDVVHDLQNRVHVLSMAVELAALRLNDMIDESRCSTALAPIYRSIRDLCDCLALVEGKLTSQDAAEIHNET
jgi:hypothetical protein